MCVCRSHSINITIISSTLFLKKVKQIRQAVLNTSKSRRRRWNPEVNAKNGIYIRSISQNQR